MSDKASRDPAASGLPSGADSITAKEAEVLDRVALGYTSKEIGQQLEISSHTADARLKSATKKLEAPSRKEAARLWLSHRAAGEDLPENYQPLVYQAPEADAAASIPDSPAHTDDGQGREADGFTDQAGHPGPAGAAAFWPFPTAAAPRNTLPLPARFIWVLLIAVLAALLFGGIMAALSAIATLI